MAPCPSPFVQIPLTEGRAAAGPPVAPMSGIDVECLIESRGWSDAGLPALAGTAVRATLDHLGVTGEVSVLGCDDARIAALNAGFRGRATATNVLSWPSRERGAAGDGAVPAPPGEGELGDIAIAYGICAAEARAADVALADHATHLLVHATLHLLGYDHIRDGDAARMEALEVAILASLGLPDPYRGRGLDEAPRQGQGFDV